MRSYLIIVALATAAPAAACPTGALCAAVDAPRDEARAAPKRPAPLRLHVKAPPTRDPWKLDEAPAETKKKRPSIWNALRRKAYERMPHYRDNTLSVVVAPVVVSSTDDTVPGLGLAGDF